MHNLRCSVPVILFRPQRVVYTKQTQSGPSVDAGVGDWKLIPPHDGKSYCEAKLWDWTCSDTRRRRIFECVPVRHTQHLTSEACQGRRSVSWRKYSGSHFGLRYNRLRCSTFFSPFRWLRGKTPCPPPTPIPDFKLF